ncbi:MAG: PQQ-binding-like beta-propeller repeat protein [Gemmataceae bacterium]
MPGKGFRPPLRRRRNSPTTWTAGWPGPRSRPGRPAAAERLGLRRRPAVAALVSLAAALTLGLIFSLFEMLRQAKERERESNDRAEEARRTSEREDGLKRDAQQAAVRERDQRRAAESVLYFFRFERAKSYWLASNVSMVEHLLADSPKELRGWEWDYMDRLCHPELFSLPGNGQFTERLLVGPGGKRLYAVSSAGLAGIVAWDLATKKPAWETTNLGLGLRAAALSPDGKTLAVGYRDGQVRLLDAATGELVRPLTKAPGGDVSYLQFIPGEGKLLVATPFGLLRCYSLTDGAEVKVPADLTRGVVTADGKRLLGLKENRSWFLRSSRQAILGTLWDRQRGREEMALGPVTSYSFTPDGKLLALGGIDDKLNPMVRVLDLGTGKLVLSATTKDDPSDLEISPDGKSLARVAFGQSTIEVWDVAAGKAVRTLRGHSGSVNSLAFLPDGRLLSCSWDNTIRCWDPKADQATRALPPNPFVRVVSDVAFQPSGEQVAFVQGDNLGAGFSALFVGNPASQAILADPRDGRFVRTLTGVHRSGVRVVRYSGDGARIIVGDRNGRVSVWDAETGKKQAVYDGHAGRVQAVALDRTGKVATSSHEPKEVTEARFGRGVFTAIPGIVKVWDAETGKERFSLTGHPSTVYRVAFSPDGKTLASACSHELRLWDPTTGKHLEKLAGPAGQGTAQLAFSPDGKQLAVSSRNGVSLIGLRADRRRIDLPGSAQDQLRAVAFHPDGKRIALSYGLYVKLLDAAEGHEILTLPMPEGNPVHVVGLGFSGDGRRLFGADSTGTILQWDSYRPSNQP